MVILSCETEGGGGSWLIEFAEVGAGQAAGPAGRGLAHHAVFGPGGAGPLRQRADFADGLRGIAAGLAASRSIVIGRAVNVSGPGFRLG